VFAISEETMAPGEEEPAHIACHGIDYLLARFEVEWSIASLSMPWLISTATR
jgi:hypothetical protein